MKKIYLGLILICLISLSCQPVKKRLSVDEIMVIYEHGYLTGLAKGQLLPIMSIDKSELDSLWIPDSLYMVSFIKKMK